MEVKKIMATAVAATTIIIIIITIITVILSKSWIYLFACRRAGFIFYG